MAKYLKIATVMDFGNGEMISLELENLKQFTQLLRNYGKEKIGGMEKEDIRAMHKLPKDDPNRFFPPNVYRFDKTAEDNAPDFIKADLCIKIEQFE